MSFRFTWPDFDPPFIHQASVELENALNRGKKPSNICDLIRVKELNMGTGPPELDILEIGEVSMDRFRGIFKLAYSGDGYLVLETKVQANPLNFFNYTASGEPVPDSFTKSSPFLPSDPSILAADCPLIVPMQLKISLLRLRAIVVLIISRRKGVTLSFKTDPLESVLVSSTFDSLPSVRRHLQEEIENRLRDLFQKELPAMVHVLSNEWLKRKGLARRYEDCRDNYFKTPNTVSSLFPAPNRILSPSSMAEKNSAPLFTKKTKTPMSAGSIVAQSAPAELENEFDAFRAIEEEFIMTANNKKENAKTEFELELEFDNKEIVTRSLNNLDNLNLLPLPLPLKLPPLQNCFSEIGFTSNDQNYHYFRSNRNIIVRATTELSLPDPVLMDANKLFKRKSLNVSKFFKSLFRISEIEADGDGGGGSDADVGLKGIEAIGLGGIETGVCSVKSSGTLFDAENCSVYSGESRSRSLLLDFALKHNNASNRALSTISGNRFSRLAINQDRYSEADPDLVQFEPDEFRADCRSPTVPLNSRGTRATEIDRRKAILLNGDSKALAVKFGIMRRLQSTLAPNTFVESNVLYRSMSLSLKNKK